MKFGWVFSGGLMLCAKASPNRWPGSFLQHQLGRMWRNPPMNHTQDSRCCQFFETSKLNSTATYPLNLQKSKLQLSSQRSWAFAVQRSWFWVMGERREAGWAYHIHPFSCILQIRCNIRVYIYIYIHTGRSIQLQTCICSSYHKWQAWTSALRRLQQVRIFVPSTRPSLTSLV